MYPVSSLRKRQSVAEVGKEDIALHYIFGADITRISNLNFIEDDVIAYIAGNAIVFHNINTTEKEYLLGIDEMGVGSIAVHPSK